MPSIANEDVLTVRYNHQTPIAHDSERNYFVSLLKLALDETVSDFGRYELKPVNIDMVQQRGVSMIRANKNIDVLWTVTSHEREKGMLAVHVPLLKGLMGYRVFLIRNNEQPLFDKINSLEQLKTLVAGQGEHWPDTAILQHNNLPTQVALDSSLHEMLERGRYDYFPRAITEVMTESHHYDNLVIEKTILLKYLSPIFYFVNKDNELLARRIEKGLLKLLENGKFEQHLYQTRNVGQLLKRLDIGNRKVFYLASPLATNKTKSLLNNKNLWLLP